MKTSNHRKKLQSLLGSMIKVYHCLNLAREQQTLLYLLKKLKVMFNFLITQIDSNDIPLNFMTNE